jgi:FKBP-type peptidyl-prolyl cis-trans isomerase
MKLWYPAIALLAAVACNNDITGLEPPSNPATETFAASLGVDIAQMTKLPNGTYIRDLTVGTGDLVVEKTDTVWVNYSLFLKDGKLVESGTNVKMQPAFLIQGFSTGMIGMKVGGERQLVIPSEMGYGDQRQPDPVTGKTKIPRQSTLIFRITLVKLHTADSTPGTTT